MLLSKPCKLLQQDQKCLRKGSYCDPLCTKSEYWDRDEPETPEGETLIQQQAEFVWFEKK